MIILLLLASLEVFAQPTLQRLDPHGTVTTQLNKVDIKTSKECSICHTVKNNQIQEKAGWSCLGCHNKNPHSGSIDHIDKKYLDKKAGVLTTITCTTCHSPHRATAINQKTQGSPLTVEPHVPKEAVFKKSLFPMLKSDCRECHKW